MRKVISLQKIYITLVVLLCMAGVAGIAFVKLGIYNISALEQHTSLVYWLLERSMKESVQRRSSKEGMPDLSDKERIRSGFIDYQEHCEQCHGGPGVAPQDFALSMTPVPANMLATTQRLEPQDIYWITENGIKMSGMPAWKYQLTEQQIWNIVAFIETLPTLSPSTYRARKAFHARQASAPPLNPIVPNHTLTELNIGLRKETIAIAYNPDRGKEAMRAYGCTKCHQIPGLTGAQQLVGPPLHAMAKRKFIAGILPNTFDNMVWWIMHPTEVDPATAMPDLGVKEAHARDIANYLYTLTGP